MLDNGSNTVVFLCAAEATMFSLCPVVPYQHGLVHRAGESITHTNSDRDII